MKLTENTRRRHIIISLSLIIGIALSCILACAGTSDVKSNHEWQTGFYLIAAESVNAENLPQPNSSQQIVLYSNRFLQDPESQPPLYLLLPTKPDVYLKLAKSPEYTAKGLNGFPELQIEMTPDASRSLEKLTRKHLGQQIAFVVDGEPVTIHKIRSIITDGKFMLSRCTDTACQYIYSRLKAKQ